MSERSDTPRTDAAISVAYAECGMKPNTPYGQEEWAGYFEEASQRLEELARQLERECEALRVLVDRAVKMLWLACPETREPIHKDSHNPLVAWVADAMTVLRATSAVAGTESSQASRENGKTSVGETKG
jgi:hypothetical protein